eukprot:NODE_459_length_8196_cov_0.388539.p2 type:complete len:213 gc:universal NODE_459_length_8196_cov_0.388539:4588-3950(-)
MSPSGVCSAQSGKSPCFPRIFETNMWFEDLIEFLVQVEAFESEQPDCAVELPPLPAAMYDIINQTLKPDKNMFDGLMQKMGDLGKKKVEASTPVKFLNGNSFTTSTPMPKRHPSNKTPSILHKAFPEDSNYSQESPARVLEWAKSPSVRQMLKEQQNIDPELIFGKLDPIVTMQKIFDVVPANALNRGDSAAWDQDKLTSEEEFRYKMKMKY